MPHFHRRLLYAATIFWSAVLLLLIQPVLTKAILPWFGGSSGVWTTSMLFFQVFLLLGYFYAHVIARRLPLRAQVMVHLALLATSALVLPLAPSASWKPLGSGDPAYRILGLLLTTVGLPYFLLSTTSPLLQSWYARSLGSRLPYRLYAVSNLGSLCALLSYPVLVEPLLAVQAQLQWWSVAYIIFVAGCGATALLSLRAHDTAPFAGVTATGRIWTWLALAAIPSILWLAIANQLSQDVAAVPFIWVVPLGIYLFSFILCFDSDGWYRPRLFRYILPLAWVAIVVCVSQQGYLDLKVSLLLLAASLFVCCMFCHGELARLRPASDELTSFYLSIATGGAAGGIFVGLIAPRVFDQFMELPIALIGCILLALWLLYSLPQKRLLRVGGVACAATIAGLFVRNPTLDRQINLRNFYGTLQVGESGTGPAEVRSLVNGTIQHGVQFVSADRSRIPTTYYGPASGAAIAITSLNGNGPIRVGVVGLGVGTLAAYGRSGDYYRFYEINPLVLHLARTEFRYLRESEAEVDVIPGDARLSMEREEPQNFDVLVMDAFAGDSIPVHLLTKEAFALYFHHLKPEGALAVHITNKHLDLAPVVKRLAQDRGAASFLIHNSRETQRNIYSSSWMVLTYNQRLAKYLGDLASPVRVQSALWTDDYSNLLRIVK
jgi:hypothetical protein